MGRADIHLRNPVYLYLTRRVRSPASYDLHLKPRMLEAFADH